MCGCLFPPPIISPVRQWLSCLCSSQSISIWWMNECYFLEPARGFSCRQAKRRGLESQGIAWYHLLYWKLLCKRGSSNLCHAYFVWVLFVWDWSKCQRSAPSSMFEVGAMFIKPTWRLEIALPLRRYNTGRRLVFPSEATASWRGHEEGMVRDTQIRHLPKCHC